MLARQATLRTVYPDAPTGPHQQVLDPAAVPLDLTPVLADADALDLTLTTGFNVRTQPPVRIQLFRRGPDEHVIACMFHHIGVYGWFLAPLAQDLAAATRPAPRTGPRPGPMCRRPSGPHRVETATFGDDADTDSRASDQINYWTTELANMPVMLRIPVDRSQQISRVWMRNGSAKV
ncbi:non-ribosomal peptide synthetase [Rhodococcus opacus M213]|uniref:Non-ribosomal peptide synthetase n=1 Tax=Rhodococcus opacus M213 TaxID=1129896 RepID=K8X9T4_RHOOP|nr:hypothetical protein [Rhodococcus opacus]EKT78288.1 non-ribosomal peptide synthetase [Rhodococcus opacus M213]